MPSNQIHHVHQETTYGARSISTLNYMPNPNASINPTITATVCFSLKKPLLQLLYQEQNCINRRDFPNSTFMVQHPHQRPCRYTDEHQQRKAVLILPLYFVNIRLRVCVCQRHIFC
ncbi:hypothetical protein MKW98_024344 [Papaver atlanticum]|uniref:Uncharacterized protein n=1 Tax=Papaver atlanticum TaxID=357466 RepID=A0AAD4SYD6_9MAGN|nr:hypothetical protein MKW98_024344 [Papaver atlanticum]